MAPIIFHIQTLYKEIYSISAQLSKHDKLGLHAEIEKSCLKMLRLSIRASLENNFSKQETIRELRMETEALKHLVRAESELKVIKEQHYLSIQEKLQEISKEAVGWERYTNKNSPS